MALGAFQNHVRRNTGYGALDVKFPIKKKKQEEVNYFILVSYCTAKVGKGS